MQNQERFTKLVNFFDRLIIKVKKNYFLLFILSTLIVFAFPLLEFSIRPYGPAFLLGVGIFIAYLILGALAFYKMCRKKLGKLGAALGAIMVSFCLFLAYSYNKNQHLNRILDDDGVVCWGVITKLESSRGAQYFKATYQFRGKTYDTFREKDYSGELEMNDTIELTVSFNSPLIYRIE